jgi:hypothetical protein
MILGFVLATVLLVGCAPRTTPEPTATTSPLPTRTSPLPAPAESPLPPRGTSPISPLPAPEEAAVTGAVAYLARSLEVAPDAVEVLSVEPVTWSDTSLGCPREGMAYAQVLTTGYRIVLEAEGQRYELHTDESGDSIVECTGE